MPVTIKIDGLAEALRRFETIPAKVNSNMRSLMDKSMRVLLENVLPYPPKPEGSKYIRTGLLGKSIGASGAKPTIYSITGAGADIRGAFGTKLSYAKYVIGEPGDPAYLPGQARVHQGRWWTMGTIKSNSEAKIAKIWDTFIKVLLSMK